MNLYKALYKTQLLWLLTILQSNLGLTQDDKAAKSKPMKYKECEQKHLPLSFYWLEEGVIAGCSVPGNIHQMKALVKEGISHLVNTSIEARPPRESVEGLTVHYFPF